MDSKRAAEQGGIYKGGGVQIKGEPVPNGRSFYASRQQGLT